MNLGYCTDQQLGDMTVTCHIDLVNLRNRDPALTKCLLIGKT